MGDPSARVFEVFLIVSNLATTPPTTTSLSLPALFPPSRPLPIPSAENFPPTQPSSSARATASFPNRKQVPRPVRRAYRTVPRPAAHLGVRGPCKITSQTGNLLLLSLILGSGIIPARQVILSIYYLSLWFLANEAAKNDSPSSVRRGTDMARSLCHHKASMEMPLSYHHQFLFCNLSLQGAYYLP